MSISNYSELVTAVTNWTHRSDLASVIPEFITLTEAKLNRDLRTRNQETSTTSLSVSGNLVTLPGDFLEARNFQINANPVIQLKYATPETIDKMDSGSYTGRPIRYTIRAGTIVLSPTPDDTYTYELHYYQKLPGLTATNASNWLITSYPDVYLYGCMAEYALYANKDPSNWLGMYKSALSGIIADDQSKYSGSTLRITPDTWA